MKRVVVLGSKFSICSRVDTIEKILTLASNGVSSYVCVSNVHTTMMATRDHKYRAAQNRSTLTVPDGMPIVWAMNLLGKLNPPQDRVRGPTLMKDVCVAGLDRNIRHFLLGSSPENLKILKENLESQHPNVQIVGTFSPPYRNWSAEDISKMTSAIKGSNANVVWVGLGAPKQELWMHANHSEVPAVCIGVGAAFDLLSGRIPEAPRILQSLGLEWAFRLYQEPKRLWKRYIWNNPAFLFLLSIELAKGLLFRKSHLCEINPGEEMENF